MNHDVIIIGAGASGLLLSILLKKMNIDVALIERNERVGVKILSTGNGRCNIANLNISKENFHSQNNNFVAELLDKYPIELVIDIFQDLGLHVASEEGRLYPLSYQASSVLDIFRINLEELNIPLYTNTKIINITFSNNTYILESSSSKKYKCNKLVLSTGGQSFPKTGSDGIGYRLARSLNHSIVKTYPALVQLKLASDKLNALSGVKFNGIANLIIDEEIIKSSSGEILYTDYGVSGIPILDLSGIATRLIGSNKKVYLSINHFPMMDKKTLEVFLDNHFNMFKERSILNCLIGILNKKLIPIFIKSSGISSVNTKVSELTNEQKNNLVNIINNWEFKIVESTGFGYSQVTSGGIDTLEINNSSLESNKNKNLYFTGEIIDVDGDCGGYNLYWAWISSICVRDSIIMQK